MQKKEINIAKTVVINQKRFTVNLLAIVMQYLSWSEDIHVRQVNKKFKEAFSQNMKRLVNFIQRDIYSQYSADLITQAQAKIR